MPGQFTQIASPDGADLSYTDPLTGLGNIKRFFDKVDRLINDARGRSRAVYRRHRRSGRFQAHQRSVSAARPATTSCNRWRSA